jgi:hypothetical protein
MVGEKGKVYQRAKEENKKEESGGGISHIIRSVDSKL